MFDKFFDLLARLVLAIETIAVALSNQAEGFAPLSPAPVVTPSPGAADSNEAEAERAALFARAKEIGLKPGPKTSNAKLKEAIAEAEAKAATPVEPATSGESTPVTVEMLRDLSKDHAKKLGKEKTREIFKNQGGGAEKIAEIVPALFGKVHAALLADMTPAETVTDDDDL